MNKSFKSKIYFVGIGGIGMSALARYFNSLGHQVIGYDKAINAQNIFLTNKKVIPLAGINSRTMYTFGKKYQSLSGKSVRVRKQKKFIASYLSSRI